MRDQSLYELLQVSENADQEIIQAAYRRLVLRYHPDRSSEPNAAEMTQRLNDAYSILSDPARKAQYDRERRGRASSSSSGTGQTSSRTSQSRPSSGTGQASSRTYQIRPNTSPPRPRRVPRNPYVDCPHCKQSVRPTKADVLDRITFFVWDLLNRFREGKAGSRSVKAGMCSNCSKPLPEN